LKKSNADPSRNLIGPTLRRLRLSQRIPVSLLDLAGRMAAQGIPIDRSAIGRIEQGKRYVLDYELVALARSLRVPLTDLFEKKN
jgi:hypothetical protein